MLRLSTGLLVAFALAACATGETYGRLDGGRPADAPLGVDAPGLDAPGLDAPPVVGTDAPVVGTDAPVLGTDAPVLGTDAPVPGTDAPAPRGAYLDRCTSASGCTSGLCAADEGGTNFCTRNCTSDAQCAFEHLCVGGTCLPDDTGAPCSVGTPETCSSGLCLGGGSGGACVRNCTSAAECPAGFACTTVAGGGATRLCVDIERPCTATGSECGTGLCDPSVGCTALCRSVADCPRTLPGLEYTCEFNAGAGGNVCVPSPFTYGADPIGAVCSPTGDNTCRSGGCDVDAVPPACVQACTPQGGCPPGSGCFPLADGGSFTLVCERAGGRDLGESCARASDCRSALCDGTTARCTRLCNDGLCPTGWRCETVIGVSICRP